MTLIANRFYSICAAVFQAGFPSGESFGDGSDSLARVAHRDERSARDGVESREALSELSSGFGSGSVELFERLKNLVKSVD